MLIKDAGCERGAVCSSQEGRKAVATFQVANEVLSSQVIPAMGKASFRVIFLPTEEGSIESSLFINTSSHGVFSYHVSTFILP
jgi:hypothetical protein